MIYLLAFPCLCVVHSYARRAELPVAPFFCVFTLIWALLFGTQIVLTGAEALIAMCFTIAVVRTVEFTLGRYFSVPDKPESLNDKPQEPNRYCARLTHDFAVDPKDSLFAVQLVNRQEWPALMQSLAEMSESQRQGFYANLNYSSLSERALLQFTRQFPRSGDAHVLMGHLQICKAKRLGHRGGKLKDEYSAMAIAAAFRSFRLALEISAVDVEARSGIVIAKANIALGRHEVEKSLRELLEFDPLHLHGIVAAARYLIKDGEAANDFVEFVESIVGPDKPAVAFARLLAHVECQLLYGSLSLTSDDVVEDLRVSYASLMSEGSALGKWQKQMSANVYACALQQMGHSELSSRLMRQLHGKASPYPWALINTANNKEEVAGKTELGNYRMSA